MVIKRIVNEEMKVALDLVWKVFLEYEAPDYTEEGIKEFKKAIDDNDWVEARDFYGAYDENNKILGVIATKDITHIALFFVDGKYHKQGIGRKLYDKIKLLNKKGFFTVNSSPYAHNLSYKEYKEWLKKEDDISKGINMPEGWIPATTYFLYLNDIPVGYGRIRHSSSEYLENIVGAGNLGYGISKEFRGKGYGNILFKELLKKCKELGYKEIKLFPLKSNEATVKIMLKNGGEIIGNFKKEKHIIRIPII